jgi:hypothetical protein
VEPKNSVSKPAQSAASSSSAQELPLPAVPSQNRICLEKQAAEPQVVVTPAEGDLQESDAEQSVAPTPLQSPSGQPVVPWGKDADDRSQSKSGKADDGAGQNNGKNIALSPRAYGSQVNPGGGFARDAGLSEGNGLNTGHLRGSASDTTEDIDPAGKSRLKSEENAPPAGNIEPAGGDWMQASGDPSLTIRGSAQDVPEDSASGLGAMAFRTTSLSGAGQKAGPADADTNPQIAVDPSLAMRRSSDAQNGTAAPATDSTGNASPTIQNWDGVRESLGQHVSAARLADVMGQSELQVNMKSGSWGPVSVRATLSNGQVGAEIQVSDREAHATLTAGLQALEKTLGDKGIQVSNLDVSRGLSYNHAQSQGQQENRPGRAYHAAKGYAHRSAANTDPTQGSMITNRTDDFVVSRVSVRA